MNKTDKTANLFILAIFILFAISAFAQQKTIVSLGLDAKLATSGAYSYDSTPVYDVLLRVVTDKEISQIGVAFEYAKLSPSYYSYGLIYNYKLFHVKSFQSLVGVEALSIIRGNHSVTYTYGLNGEVVYWINNIGLSALLNYKRRSDLADLYNDKRFVTSGFVSLSLKI